MRALGVTCILALVACSDPPAAPVLALGPSSASVRWVEARAPGGTALLEAPASVLASPGGHAVVAAPLRARIVAIATQPGATVTKGQVLVEVALPEAVAASGAYLAAADEITAYEARAKQLAALQQEGLARQADVAAVNLELAKLRGVRDTAAATLRAANLEVSSARALAASGGRTTLRAPIAGTVMAVTAIAGATVAPEAPLVEIVAAGATRIEAHLPRDLPPNVRVEFVAVGAPAIVATFVASAPSREPDGTTKAWFELASPAPANAAGRIRATLPDGAAVLVPATALAREGADQIVFRRTGDATAQVRVRVLATSGGDALVEGLAVGDRIAAVATLVTPEVKP